MISKQNRFHGRKSLDYIYRKGQAVRGEMISLRFAPSRRNSYRLAVVVSRKVSKSAVVRNRIRRRIYEIVRLHNKNQPLKSDIIASVYDSRLAETSQEELKKTVSSLLKKVER